MALVKECSLGVMCAQCEIIFYPTAISHSQSMANGFQYNLCETCLKNVNPLDKIGERNFLSESNDCKKCGRLMDDSKECCEECDIDDVNHPPHYTQGGIETLDFIKAKLTPEEYTGYLKGNIVKYLSRSNLKGGLKDLKKAQFYLNTLIGSSNEKK